MSHREFREFLNKCDRAGLIIKIERAGPKNFNLLQNYEVIKNYKTRASAKKRVIKIYNETVNQPN